MHYRLLRAEKVKNGIVKHEAVHMGREDVFRYLSIRIGLVCPGQENPAFFVVGGMEVEDELSPSPRGLIRILQEEEVNDLSLNILFDTVTSAYTAMLADALYVDAAKEDFKMRLWDYLDAHNLRTVSIENVAYKDPVLRLSSVKDFQDAGDLLIDRGSPLFQDLQGVSRSHLRDDFESKYFRLNALGYLVSSFAKYPPKPPLTFKVRPTPGGSMGWAV
jgi:hypothetical protein